MKKITILISIVLLFLNISTLKAQDAATILKKVDEITSSPKDISQTVQITLIDKANRQQVRTALMMQKGDDKRIIKFTSPAEQKGIGFLSLPNDVMYLYMPAYGKERRIASSVKNQKFAGTDMSYEDLEAKNYSDKYNAKLLSSANSIFELELTPKVAGEYSKVILKVNSTNYIPLSADFYDKGGTKVKATTFEFVKQGTYWYAKTLTVKDLKANHTTIMKSTEVKFDQNLSDDLFTVRNLAN